MYRERRSGLLDAVVWHSIARGPHRVLPDGCMDVLWWRGRLVVAGPDTAAHVSDVRPGEHVIGLRFDPGVLPAMLGVPASELADRRPDLVDLWGTARVAPIEDRIGDSCDPRQVEQAFRQAAPSSESTPDTAARRELVRRIGEGASIAELSDELGWSERHLLRRSREAFGYAPSVLRRVLRLQRALLAARAGVPLAQVAQGAGYYDQAHLSRDVRALAGTTMGSLLSP